MLLYWGLRHVHVLNLAIRWAAPYTCFKCCSTGGCAICICETCCISESCIFFFVCNSFIKLCRKSFWMLLYWRLRHVHVCNLVVPDGPYAFFEFCCSGGCAIYIFRVEKVEAVPYVFFEYFSTGGFVIWNSV